MELNLSTNRPKNQKARAKIQGMVIINKQHGLCICKSQTQEHNMHIKETKSIKAGKKRTLILPKTRAIRLHKK